MNVVFNVSLIVQIIKYGSNCSYKMLNFLYRNRDNRDKDVMVLEYDVT